MTHLTHRSKMSKSEDSVQQELVAAEVLLLAKDARVLSCYCLFVTWHLRACKQMAPLVVSSANDEQPRLPQYYGTSPVCVCVLCGVFFEHACCSHGCLAAVHKHSFVTRKKSFWHMSSERAFWFCVFACAAHEAETRRHGLQSLGLRW